MSAYVSLPLYLLTVPQRYALVAKRCMECGTLHFPARPVCSNCGKPRWQDEKLSGLGAIHTFTVISKGGGPAEFDDQQNMTGAYAVAIVELEEGPRVIGQLTDITPEASRITIGMKVKAVVRRIYDQEGVIRYSFKFKPVQKATGEFRGEE